MKNSREKIRAFLGLTIVLLVVIMRVNLPDIYPDVYSSTDFTSSIGIGSIFNAQAGVGWVEDSFGNVVTDPAIIKDVMEGLSATTSMSVLGGISSYSSFNRYTFKAKSISPSVNISLGASYTKYLGTKDKVSRGEF